MKRITAQLSSVQDLQLIDLKDQWRRSQLTVKETRTRIAKKLWARRRKLREQRRLLVNEWKNLLEEDGKIFIESKFRALQRKSEQDTLLLAIEIAKRFLQTTLSSEHTHLIQQIHRELAKKEKSPPISLSVHPDIFSNVHKELSSMEPKPKIYSEKELPPGKAKLTIGDDTLFLDWEHEFSHLTRHLFQRLLDQHVTDATVS